ncbi:hypothetical protein [Acinetobacter larvae]|uniref:Restriction endonuclease n=1 Tax=Acinetobacter larvae TaxID=1789224 RepID=A0A1B2LX98_9GAMM|nr:hypothetical protein [Acinetobacter larvae]AOA57561.1 hypothetical protein BFG52_03800 [Acinetobacter larvae]
MFELEKFQKAFEISFPVEAAQQILGLMESLYGSEFERVHGKTDADLLIENTRLVLDGITPEQLQNGIKLMRSERWCPTLPGFRFLCLQDGDWWTAEQAWTFALNWKKDSSKPITTLAKRTLGEVSEVLNGQGQKAAYKAFIDTYEYNLRQAKARNCTQVMWVKPKTSDDVKQQKTTERNRSGMPCPPELAAKIKGAYRGNLS